MVDRGEVEERLSRVFRDAFGDHTIRVRDEMSAQDVEGWDSVAHVTLLSMVEQEFSIKFRLAEIGRLNNVGEMIDLILARLK